MWAKFRNFSHSIFFLIIGICFTLQVAFWQSTDLVWMTLIVSFLAIPILDSLAGARKFPSLASFGTFAHWVPRLYFIIHFIKRIPNQFSEEIIFGHNPGLTDLASDIWNLPILNIPTSGVIELIFEISSWQGIHRKSIQSAKFDFPKNTSEKPINLL